MLRRDFLSVLPIAVGITSSGRALAFPGALARSILDYGALPDSKTLNTRSIQRAIDDVFQSGGGTVNVPAGIFLTGRIELKTGITLNLQAGCTLLGSTSMNDYTSSAGTSRQGDANLRHLIFAQDADDVMLTGTGRIDGQGSSFWEPSGKPPVPQEDQWGDYASRDLAPRKSGRPSPMLEFVNCRRLKVDSIHIENAPGWTFRIVNCDTVEIHGIAIKNPIIGPNTDGIDITGSQNVNISNCSVDTGDDAICLKSENPYGQEPRLIKNIVVTNCVLTTCCNGFKLGTGSEGGFENISFSNSTIVNQEVDFRNRVISGVALEMVDGGWIDGVTVTGIKMQRTRTPIFIRLGNRKRAHDYPKHGLRGVKIDDIQATEAILASSITGLPGAEVRDVILSHIQVENVLPSRPEWVGRVVPEKEAAYPEARMFGMLPASGLYVRHARDIGLNDVAFHSPVGEARPTIIFDDVVGALLTKVSSTPVRDGKPMMQVWGSKDVKVSELHLPHTIGEAGAIG